MIKDVSEVGEEMKKQEQMVAGQLPQGLQSHIQNLIAEAMQGKFGQIELSAGMGKGGDPIKIRMLVFPDAILMETKEEK